MKRRLLAALAPRDPAPRELAAPREEARPDQEMPFTEHLAELRTRIVRSLIAVVIGAVLVFQWADAMFAFLTGPLHAGIKNTQIENGPVFNLIGTGPAEAFIVKLKVAIASGALLVSPILFYQLWCFIAPALYSNERKLALPFVGGSTVCFLIGVSFCFWVVLPYAFGFFLSEYMSIGVSPELRIGEYLAFTLRILIVFGVVFELPVLSYFLARMGLITHRWLIEKCRYSIVGIFIVAAILTPPDVVTQCLLAIPLVILYGICIVVTYYAHPEQRKASQVDDQSPPKSPA